MLGRSRPVVPRLDAAPLAPPPGSQPGASLPLLGNNRDLDRLYRDHFAFVWRSLRRLGVPPQALDDAVQDVFFVALRRHEAFKGRSSDRTWLFGIAANISHEERRRGRRASALQAIDERVPAQQSSPLQQASDAEAARFVQAFLDTLDDQKREVFILSELEQMPAPEIAEAVGTKLNTVYSRLRAARTAFAEFLEALEARKR